LILITVAELKSLSKDHLLELAKKFAIEGRASMKKNDLILAITRVARRSVSKKTTIPKLQKSKKTEQGEYNDRNDSAAVSLSSKNGLADREDTKFTAPLNAPAIGTKSKPPKARRKSAESITTEQNLSNTVISGRKNAVIKSSSTTPTKPTAQTLSTPKDKAEQLVKGRHRKLLSIDESDSGIRPKMSGIGKATLGSALSMKSQTVREEMRRRSMQLTQNRDLSTGILIAGSALRLGGRQGAPLPHKDRISLIVRDSYWLQADWEITRASVERIRVGMSEKWHKARPVLRLVAVGDASSSTAEQLIRDIFIHGGVSNWYIDVDQPPSRFRVVIGYLAENEKFYAICRSNVVTTPKPDAANRLDLHWRDIAEDYERIYSLSGGHDPAGGDELKELFEERLQRQMPIRAVENSTSDTESVLDRHRTLPFEVDAELILFGSTTPGATVLLSGEPVKLRADGTFTVRVALPDKRQVLPVVAQSKDSMKQRTTVIAVERNTKVMEAVDRDQAF
jgi:hypothetical protein